MAVASREHRGRRSRTYTIPAERDGGISGSRAPGVRLAVPDDAPDLGHAGSGHRCSSWPGVWPGHAL